MRAAGRHFLKIVGVDGAIALTILSRLIQAGGGIVSIIFIAAFLTKNEQGYYYTFTSIIAVQVFFELGLSGIITQYVAHEFAHLRVDKDGEIVGDESARSRLSSLLHFCVKWFGIISGVLLLVLLAVGYYFFLTFNKGENIEWQKPWLILCIATSLNLFIDPLLAYFDGLGRVKDMAQVRLIQKSAFLICLMIFFVLGFRLYSISLASLFSILINYIQIIFSERSKILKKIWKLKGSCVISYSKEIFPYQWRIALSWISGYFIFQLFNPVIFATEGAVAAGKMGMTLQFLGGISTLSMSWINTKVPLFSSFIAKREFRSLDLVFDKTLLQLAVVNGILLLLFICSLVFMNTLGIMLYQRFLPLLPLVLLCLITFSNQFVFSWATYLRCHKQEPFLVNSIVSGVLCALSTLTLGRYYGVIGVVVGYFLITTFIAFPWGYNIFKAKRKEWHT